MYGRSWLRRLLRFRLNFTVKASEYREGNRLSSLPAVGANATSGRERVEEMRGDCIRMLSSRIKRKPSGSRKSIRYPSWPLTGMNHVRGEFKRRFRQVGRN